MSDYPDPSDTKKRLEQQGIPADDIKEKVDNLRDSIGGAVKPANREAFLHVVAAKQFGVGVGDLPTMDRGGEGGGELKRLHCADVTPEVISKDNDASYHWRGWLLNTFTYEKKGEERLGGTLLDTTGAASIMSFVTVGTRDLTETLAHELGSPVFVELENVQLFSPGDGDFTTVTYGQYASAESIDAEFTLAEAAESLPDAAEDAVDYGEFARVEGVVTDERRSAFKACADCGASLGGLDDFQDSCPKCGAARHGEREFHRLAVTDGGATLDVSLPPDIAPGRDLSFHAIKAVCEWREGNDDWDDEYRAVWFEASSDREFGTPAEELADSDEDANQDLKEPTAELVTHVARDMGATETNGISLVDLEKEFKSDGFDDALDQAIQDGALFEPTLGEIRCLED